MKFRASAFVALLLMSLLWGYSWTAVKIALESSEPYTLVALRMCISAACLLLALPLTGRRFLPVRVPELIKVGLVQTTGLMILSTWAVATGSPGRVAFLAYTMPFFTLALAWPLLGERLRGTQWIACGLAAVGLAFVIEPWSISGGMLDNFLAVSAGFAWAVSAIMVKQLQNREPMDLLSMTAWQMAFGCVPLLILAWWIPEAPIRWSGNFVVVLLGISLMTSALGWFLWLYVLNNMPAGMAAMSTLAAPLVAMASSAFHLGERPSTSELIGMVLITTALLALSIKALREHRDLPSTIVQGEGA